MMSFRILGDSIPALENRVDINRMVEEWLHYMACSTTRHRGKGLELIYHEVIGRSREALVRVKGLVHETSRETDSRRASEDSRKASMRKTISFKLGPLEETYTRSESRPLLFPPLRLHPLPSTERTL